MTKPDSHAIKRHPLLALVDKYEREVQAKLSSAELSFRTAETAVSLIRTGTMVAGYSEMGKMLSAIRLQVERLLAQKEIE